MDDYFIRALLELVFRFQISGLESDKPNMTRTLQSRLSKLEIVMDMVNGLNRLMR